MFKRPHSSKTTTPIRSSDLRKLREEVLQTFPESELTKECLKLLLPDGSLIGKATTHLDEPITIYYSPSPHQDPRFFRMKGSSLIPTCYSFDLLPNRLLAYQQGHRLETAQAVVENLQSGSALFLAGVSNRSLSNLSDSLKIGDLVSISTVDHQQVVAIGQLANTKSELLKEYNSTKGDKKGKAVITLHARGDYLWQTGSKSIPTTSIESVPPEEVETSLSTNLASTSLEREPEPEPEQEQEQEQEQLNPEQVDQILYRSILLSISQLSPNNYPIPASSFYSSHILPNRPSSPLNHSTIDLKKSSYKKLSGLIKFVNKKGWLVSKEVRGELIIMSGNREHQDVTSLRSYKTVQMLENATATTSATTENSPTTTTTTSQASQTTTITNPAVVVNEYFKPSSTTLKQFLSLIPHKRPTSDLYSSPNLKQLFLTYLKDHHLVHENSQKHFKIIESPELSLEDISHQELLVSLLLKKGEKLQDISKDQGVLTKDEGFKKFLSNSGFTEYWGLSSSGQREREEEEEEEVVQKGKPPMIKIQIKNVGKRQVTLISGHEAWLESFSTNSEQISEELKHKTASSVSIQPVNGSAKKNQTPKVEIMCQGTHDKLVMGLLISKGVPKKYIEVDTSKSKK